MAFADINFPNPLLDEDDDFTPPPPASTSTPLEEVTNPLLEDDDDEHFTPTPTESKPWERVRTAEEKADLAVRVAAGELLPGRKKRDPEHSTYNRKWVTSQDEPILRHISKFAHASTAIVCLLYPDRANSTINRRLLGQSEAKWLRHDRPFNSRGVFSMTSLGLEIAEMNKLVVAEQCPEVKPGEFYRGQPEHTLAVSLIAAQVQSGGFYDLEGRGASTGAVAHHRLIPEYRIASAWSTLQKEAALQQRDAGQLRAELIVKMKKAVGEGKFGWAEAFDDYPELFVVAMPKEKAKHLGALSDHTPDLVISFEDKRKETAVSASIEVELTAKSASRYKALLTLLAADKFTARQIMWFYDDEATARRIRRVDEEFGLEAVKRMSFHRIVGTDKQPFTGTYGMLKGGEDDA